MLIKAPDNLVFFAFERVTLLYLVSWLKKEISTWISMYVPIFYLNDVFKFDLLQLKCFIVQRQSSGRFYRPSSISFY